MAAAAARRANACSRSRRCRAARISRISRATPESAKLICSGIARPAFSQILSAAAGSHSATVSSTMTAENSRRRNWARAAFRPSATSTSMPSCALTTAAQFRAPSIPVTIRMLISNPSFLDLRSVALGLPLSMSGFQLLTQNLSTDGLNLRHLIPSPRSQFPVPDSLVPGPLPDSLLSAFQLRSFIGI